MANYMLLRNNKESGPYSVDGLMELGLKAYDLVWVQGKSAAWRYPSEVEELKPFAPVVEEQPFDRFYKKPADTKKELLPVAKEETLKQESNVVATQHEKYIPKKSVYVTMPGQKATAATQSIKETLPTPPVQPTITISENPAAAQVKYSQPLDEIKEMYVKTLQDRKQKIARKGFWLQNLKKAAALFSLVAVGIIAGFVIKSNNGNKKEIAKTDIAIPTQQVKTESSVIVPDANTITNLSAPTEDSQPLHQPTGGIIKKSPTPKEKPIELTMLNNNPANTNVKKEIEKTSSENKLATSLVAPRGIDIDPATGERSRKVRNENNEPGNNGNTGNAEKKSLPADDISHLVSVKSNEYKKVAFGGIRDLQLTVTNDSKYILDNVTVELQYIKPNELPLRTENIQFTSVGPNATSTIRVPDTNRGIKVAFRITNIKKRQMDGSVAGN